MFINDQKLLIQFLVTDLNWTAIANKNETIEKLYDYLQATTSHGFYQIPGFFLTDIAQLLQYGYDAEFVSDRRQSHSSMALKQLRSVQAVSTGNVQVDQGLDIITNTQKYRVLAMRYEREFLNRLLQLQKFHELVEIVQTSDNQQARIKRILIIFAQALQKVLPAIFQLNPILLRELQFNPDLIDSNEHRFNDLMATWLEKFLANLSKAFNWSSLIQEQDIFELGHWDSLDTEHARLGCRQIIELEQSFPELPFSQLFINEPETDVETRYIDHTYVPSGGVAELTNRGSFESLVSSELLYIDETHQEVNLFDLRYIEGELLFYLRDDGTLLRKRRVVFFIFDLDSTLQVKPLATDYQISVLVQALMLRLYLDLITIFQNDAVRASFHYITAENNQGYLENEAKLLQIMLADDIQHDKVEFCIANNAAIDVANYLDQKPYVVIFSEKQEHYWADWFADNLATTTLNSVQVSISSADNVNPDCIIDPETINKQRLVKLRRHIIAQLLA